MTYFSCLRCVTPAKCGVHGCSPGTWAPEPGVPVLLEPGESGPAAAVVTVTLPVNLPPEVLLLVREHPTTRTEDREEEHRRIGWLLCAWDVIVSQRTKGLTT